MLLKQASSCPCRDFHRIWIEVHVAYEIKRVKIYRNRLKDFDLVEVECRRLELSYRVAITVGERDEEATISHQTIASLGTYISPSLRRV